MEEVIKHILPRIIELRRELHAHPQIRYEETYASELVQRELKRMGIEFKAPLAETGVVAWILPHDSEKAKLDAIAFRADMDALEIGEDTCVEYKSVYPGFMHACGHDGHTAILLGAAEVLNKMRDKLTRPVKLIFQPAEETGGGAEKIIEQGALDETVGGVKVAMCFALHGWCDYTVGEIASMTGPIFAAPDRFTVKVFGRGGHGAMPEQTNNPIIAAAQIALSLRNIVGQLPAGQTGVVSVCVFNAGDTLNVIPQTAEIGGTTRAFNEQTRKILHDSIQQIADKTAKDFSCKAETSIHDGYPVTVNDPAAVEFLKSTVQNRMAGETFVDMQKPVMVGEDFSYYAQKVSSCLALLGIRDPHIPADDFPKLHSSRFDFPDAAIEHGIKMFCSLAVGGVK